MGTTADPSASRFVKVGEVRQFREGRGRAVTVEGTTIAVFRRRRRFYAVGDRCPHMGASISMGRLVGDKVQCAWHGWQYDLSTGRHAFKDWACLPVYEVRVEGNDVLVALPAPAPGDGGPTHPENEEPARDDWFVWDPDR